MTGLIFKDGFLILLNTLDLCGGYRSRDMLLLQQASMEIVRSLISQEVKIESG